MTHLRIAVLLLAALSVGASACGGARKREAAASKFAQLGQTKLHEGNAEGAVADLTKAWKMDPENAETRHLLGLAYWHKGNVLRDESLKLEAEKIILDSFALKEKQDLPVPGDWHNNLGALYVDLRRWSDAVVHLQKAIKDPEYRTPERPLNNLSKASLEQRKYLEALEYADRALRIQPRFCMALVNKGLSAKALGRKQEALEAFLKVIETEECSGWPEPYLRVGLIYYESKRPKDARQHLQKAKQADPDGPIGKEAERYLRSIGN